MKNLALLDMGGGGAPLAQNALFWCYNDPHSIYKKILRSFENLNKIEIFGSFLSLFCT